MVKPEKIVVSSRNENRAQNIDRKLSTVKW